MKPPYEVVKYLARFHDLLEEADEDGVDPEDLIDALICGLVSVGSQHRIEPEAIFWELRQRWQNAKDLHLSIVSGH